MLRKISSETIEAHKETSKSKMPQITYQFKPWPGFATSDFSNALIPGTLIFSVNSSMDVSHVCMYAPEPGSFSDICHITPTGATRHTLAFLSSEEISKCDDICGFMLFKPKDRDMGMRAAKQARFWSQTGTQFDERRSNMMSIFLEAPEEMKRKEMSFQEPKNFSQAGIFHALKMLTRVNTKPTRAKMDEKEERGQTCHGFVIDCYNASALYHKFKNEIQLEEKLWYSNKNCYTEAPSAIETPGYLDYVQHLKNKPLMLSYEKAKIKSYAERNAHKHIGTHTFPQFLPVVEILPSRLRQNISAVAKEAPIQLDPKYLLIGKFADYLATNPLFQYIGITNIIGISPKESKELNRKEKIEMMISSKTIRQSSTPNIDACLKYFFHNTHLLRFKDSLQTVEKFYNENKFDEMERTIDALNHQYHGKPQQAELAYQRARLKLAKIKHRLIPDVEKNQELAEILYLIDAAAERGYKEAKLQQLKNEAETINPRMKGCEPVC